MSMSNIREFNVSNCDEELIRKMASGEPMAVSSKLKACRFADSKYEVSYRLFFAPGDTNRSSGGIVRRIIPIGFCPL